MRSLGTYAVVDSVIYPFEVCIGLHTNLNLVGYENRTPWHNTFSSPSHLLISILQWIWILPWVPSNIFHNQNLTSHCFPFYVFLQEHKRKKKIKKERRYPEVYASLHLRWKLKYIMKKESKERSINWYQGASVSHLSQKKKKRSQEYVLLYTCQISIPCINTRR